MMRKFLNSLGAYAIICALVLASTPAPTSAQIAVFDNSSFLQLKNTLSTVQSQLGQLQQIYSTVQKLQNAIGQLGPAQMLGQIMGLLNSLKLGQFQNVLSGLQPSLSGFTSAAGGASSAITGLQNAFNQASSGISGTKNALSSALYTTSANPTVASVQNLTVARAANVREAATNAAAAGLQGRQTTGTNGATDLNQLTAAVKATQDLRGDIQANSAILLKLLEQQQQTNAQLSSLLHLQGAAAIASDSPTSPNGGQ